MRRTDTKILVHCGLMVALAMVLSFIPIYEMPMGGIRYLVQYGTDRVNLFLVWMEMGASRRRN